MKEVDILFPYVQLLRSPVKSEDILNYVLVKDFIHKKIDKDLVRIPTNDDCFYILINIDYSMDISRHDFVGHCSVCCFLHRGSRQLSFYFRWEWRRLKFRLMKGLIYFPPVFGTTCKDSRVILTVIKER